MRLGRLERFWSRRRRELPDLATRIACFREVLHANNAALGYLADIQHVLARGTPITGRELRRLVAGVTTQAYRMIVNLNRMTADRFRDLVPRFDQIKDSLARTVETREALPPGGYVVPLDGMEAALAEFVGQKSAFLGEARRLLPGHVPDGFGTSVDASRTFMEADGLQARVAAVLPGDVLGDVTACYQAAARASRMVEAGRLPESLARAIAAAAQAGRRYAVRSSALMEGGLEMSFAGQYRSFLNVPAEAVGEAFARVMASKYSPEALVYRAARGVDDRDVEMCCCIIEMVDAVASGVVYSRTDAGGDAVALVQAVRGLGQSAVDGSAEPDSYWVDLRSEKILEQRTGRQEWQIVPTAPEGTARVRLAPADVGREVLDTARVLEVARLASALGGLFAAADLEWAIGPDGRVFVVQVRPQALGSQGPGKALDRRLPGRRVLLAGGSPASAGCAAGPAWPVASALDILGCPPGAVLVTHEASPRLAVLLPRAAAIVADLGEVTGHLATVAREMHIPALFAARTATARIPAGTLVTVDADAAVVYEGRVDALLSLAPPPRAPARPIDPNLALLASVTDRIVPLTLRDRLASGGSPRACRTLHDIIRFCHQATIEAMFDLGDRAMRTGDRVRRLVSTVPIDCRLYDLGGGLEAGAPDADVPIEAVTCRPMRALWAGMTDPELRWNIQRPVSLAGFMSALVNYNFDQDARLRQMGEPSYAFITGQYLNLNSRVGFHFSTVDALVGDVVESNYVSFRFVGGSTGIDQRSRRAALLERLLAAGGFETDRRADLVNARLRHRPAGEMEAALARLGRMIGFVNHLDMVLVSDGLTARYEQAFLAGDYSFSDATDDA